jgi:hypothetical protein
MPRNNKRTFHQDLVLHRWLCSFFYGDTIRVLKDRLGEDRYEGFHDDGQTLFFHELTRNLFNMDKIHQADLRRYDLNVGTHWKQITARRTIVEGHVLHMKYFQYLSLLFTEIYLDWFFNRRQELLDGLNAELARFNAENGAPSFQPYSGPELNKIAYWNATGSGKTLLLHVNILQYQHYFRQKHPNQQPDKIILLTPNDGLSRQHLEEAALSGFGLVKLFDKDRAPDFKGTIEIIDINKLADTMGVTQVAVEAFEGNNLVLVDEGHRGAGKAADAWMRRRAAVVSSGFAFEYSATFGQAVGKGMTVAKAEAEAIKAKAKVLFNTTKLKDISPEKMASITLDADERRKAAQSAMHEIYGKCTLFDYSYKFFYEDGYGKDFLILNLKEAGEVERRDLYFTACLLAFYQQLWLWDTHKERLTDFNIAKPLWVFVGNKVNDDDSDVRTVVEFIASFLNNPVQIQTWLADLLTDRARILDTHDRNIFEGRFRSMLGRDPQEVYADILRKLFNAPSAQRLKLVNIKSGQGELALRVGDAEPFGLINIGDDAKFFNAAADAAAFSCEEDAFATALFPTIDKKESHLNLLIGSRKFTEGWSSWRVSTMGLLNMGTGEGSQIIQLFGRGVRLKGLDFSLKRSTPANRPKDLHLEKLETLNIFGVRANYMAKFKEYLIEEGITPTDEILQLDFETRSSLPAHKLKTLGLKDGYKDNQKHGFKRKVFPALYEIPASLADNQTGKAKLKMPHVVVDLYPRIEALEAGKATRSDREVRAVGTIRREIMAHFDWDRIFLAVQDYKLQRTWNNLRVDQQRLRDFCLGPADWYTLYAPPEYLHVTSYADIIRQENILIQLLVDYTDRYYKALKNAYEGQFYEVIPMDDAHGSMLKLYQFEIENTDDGRAYKAQLEQLQDLVKDGKFGEASRWNPALMVAICFDRHLYYPLIHIEDKKSVPLKMRPMAFDTDDEVRFVKDLESFYRSEDGRKAIGNRSLYLMRNADVKSKGLGFATAGNFFPDFLLWLVDETTGQQWLTFIDPKGLLHQDINSPKLQLYREIKNIEADMGDANLILNAFILSVTPFQKLLNLGNNMTPADLESRHILFMDTPNDTTYIQKLFHFLRSASGHR